MSGAASEPPHHVAAALVGGLGYSGQLVLSDATSDREPLYLQPKPFQLSREDFLSFLLLSDGARRGHELFQKGERAVSSRGDFGVEPVRIQAAHSLKWSNV